MARTDDDGDNSMKIALEYLDEDARIAVTEIDANGEVITWYPDHSSKEPESGKRIYISLVKEVIDSKDSDLHMYQGIGSVTHEEGGFAYEYIEGLLVDPKDTYDMVMDGFQANMTKTERKEFQRAN